jgi:DNA-binding CsgD family transcriptional regulator
MPDNEQQTDLFPAPSPGNDGTVIINERCRLQRRDGFVVVTVSGVVIAHFRVGDRMAEAHAMVALVDQGHARQRQVARAFGCDERTVRRHQRRLERGGLAALGRPRGYPRGQPRLAKERAATVNDWKASGATNREIARRLGVDEKSVRKLLRRLGWRPPTPEQLSLPVASRPVEAADPKLSGSPTSPPSAAPTASTAPNAPGPPADGDAPQPVGAADPKLSALDAEPPAFSRDPCDRTADRVLACLGLLDDAAPMFAPAKAVLGLGVLLAIPPIIHSGVLDIARDIYGGIGPAFYGLRTTIVTLILMALLRIKRPEALKEHSPQGLGRLLGLDRAPEVKTLRRKLGRLAAGGCASTLGRALAQRRVQQRGHAMGFLYVDGHVRAYHGKRPLPKTHLARMRLAMPATTDYWVNDAEGEPLFFVTTEANRGLVKMLPVVLQEVRALVGERRVTVVFDRGGWSPELFRRLIEDGFDVLTYRKGKCRRLAKRRFATHDAVLDGRPVRYLLADQAVLLLGRKLRLRQVSRLTDDGHQTQIITSRWDLSAVEVAHRMFERWRQENFFKYLREEYALDALVDYGTESADANRDVPNPARQALNAELRRAYAELARLAAALGVEAATNRESLRRTMRGFKIANAKLGKQIQKAAEKIRALEKRRASVPVRIPVQDVVMGEVIKLAVERKHLTDIFKMVAYQAESDLSRLIASYYPRAEDEGRTLVQSALALAGEIVAADGELRIVLDTLSSPHKTRALGALCDQLNETDTRFPGTTLRLRFAVKPEPIPSLAFPGARQATDAPATSEPDISA